MCVSLKRLYAREKRIGDEAARRLVPAGAEALCEMRWDLCRARRWASVEALS